jgi:AraC-like DNA-binding protein
MNPSAAPFVEHRHFVSRNAEQTRAYLATHQFRFDIAARDARAVDTRLSGFSLPGMYLGRLQYGAYAEIHTTVARNDYRILPPRRGHLQAVMHNQTIECGPGGGIITSPTHPNLVRSEGGSSWLNVFLRADAVNRQLVALLGASLRAPLELAPQLDLTAGYGRGIAAYVELALAELEQPGPMVWNPVTISLFEQFIICRLLLSHPHNYTELLRRCETPIAPRDVKRAIDFIEANLDAPITLADIVQAAHVPGRTLFKHFEDFRGISPMSYLRNARFERVRQALRRADPSERVTDIALQWGFGHMGRFAVQYRKRFGESPSETLRKRRPKG